MDDHLIESIYEKIQLCFFCAKLELDQNIVPDITKNIHYQGAKELIKSHNALVRLYYVEDYHKTESLGSVKKEWKRFLENN
ncbi:MAG: hypothetical protein RR620_12045 [Clostridium sp.]